MARLLGLLLCSWIFVFVLTSLNFNIVQGQELAHFNKSSGVDFETDNVWAEITPLSKGNGAGKSKGKSGAGSKGKPDGGSKGKDKVKEIITETITTERMMQILESSTSGVSVSANEKDKVKIAAVKEKVGRVVIGTSESSGNKDRTSTKKPINVFAEIYTEDRGGNIPPYIRKPANGQTRYPEPEKPMTIQCEADGVTPVTYSWFRNGIKVESTGKNIKAFPNGTLTFPTYTSRENGAYHCQAQNAYGTDLSPTFQIIAQLRPMARSSNKTIRHMKVKKGEKANIPCGEVPDTIPPYNKRWYHGQNSSELRTNHRIGTDSQGTLHYAYTLLSDNRSYKCGLVPTKGSVSNIILFNELHLEVEDSTEAGNFPPNKEYVTEGAKAIIGKPFIFDCFFSGNPAPQIKWINNTNHDITPSDSRYDIMNDGRQLKIYEVRQEDEGTFKCTAENIRAQKEANIFLNVTSPPWRTAESLRPHTKINQRDFTLTCKAQAASRERLETPIWYRNGEELRRENLPDPARYQFSEDFTELRIKKMDKTVDTASYQCKVVNSEGELFMNGYLRVINSIIITKRPPDVIKVTANSTEHDITVLATGDSCCNINRLYSFNNTQLTEAALSKPPFRTNKADQTVTFVPSSVSREDLERWIGTYTCRMSNQHQHEDIHFQISYTSDPSPILAKESTVGLWWIGVICGVLAIIITIIVVFVIYKSNYPGDTYQLEKTELKHNLNPQEDLLNQSFQEI